MNTKVDGYIAGFICVGTLIAVFEHIDLLRAGEYSTFIWTALGAAFLSGLAFVVGLSAYTGWFSFHKKEETPLNRVLFWAGFLAILGIIVWVGFR